MKWWHGRKGPLSLSPWQEWWQVTEQVLDVRGHPPQWRLGFICRYCFSFSLWNYCFFLFLLFFGNFLDIKGSTLLGWWPRFICRNFSIENLSPSSKDTVENLFRKLRSGGAGLLIWLGSRASAGSRSHFCIFTLCILHTCMSHFLIWIVAFCKFRSDMGANDSGGSYNFWKPFFDWNSESFFEILPQIGVIGASAASRSHFCLEPPLAIFLSPPLWSIRPQAIFLFCSFFLLFLFACLMYSNNFLQLAFSLAPIKSQF